MAIKDQNLVKNITKINAIISQNIQLHLLEFVKDPFIGELLPNLTKYVQLVEHGDHSKHALKKADEILSQLK